MRRASACAAVSTGLDPVAGRSDATPGAAVLVQLPAVVDVFSVVVIRHDGVLAEDVGHVVVAVERVIQDVLEARARHAVDRRVVDVVEVIVGRLVTIEVDIDLYVDIGLAVDVDMGVRRVFIEVGVQVAVGIQVAITVQVGVAVAVAVSIAVTVQIAVAIQVAVVGFAVLRLALALALILSLPLALILSLPLALALSLTLELALELSLQLSLSLALTLILVLALVLARVPWEQEILVLAHNDHLKLRPP